MQYTYHSGVTVVKKFKKKRKAKKYKEKIEVHMDMYTAFSVEKMVCECGAVGSARLYGKWWCENCFIEVM